MLTSIAVGWLMQMPTLRAPTGMFPVGTLTGWLPQPSTQDRSAVVTAQIWYPALTQSAGSASTEDVVIAWHGIRFDRRYRTAAVTGAAAADRPGGFPVIVYVPEWGGAAPATPPWLRNWPAGASPWSP